jgi:predicted nucleic acid-binding protein
VRLKDPDWHAPLLWRSELRSVLTGFMRRGAIDRQSALLVMQASETALHRRSHDVPSDAVLETAERSQLSAYDCEFVALAQLLDVALVSADAAILRAFPQVAMTMRAFLRDQ